MATLKLVFHEVVISINYVLKLAINFPLHNDKILLFLLNRFHCGQILVYRDLAKELLLSRKNSAEVLFIDILFKQSELLGISAESLD